MFKPGVSGNPGGRPKGIGPIVRARTGDGDDIVAAWLFISSAPAADIEARYGTKATIRDRLVALDALADRGFGKPLQVLAGEDGGPVRVIFGGRYMAGGAVE